MILNREKKPQCQGLKELVQKLVWSGFTNKHEISVISINNFFSTNGDFDIHKDTLRQGSHTWPSYWREFYFCVEGDLEVVLELSMVPVHVFKTPPDNSLFKLLASAFIEGGL